MSKKGADPLFAEIDPPRGLFGAILACIAHERRRVARIRLAASGSAVLVSVALLVPAVSYALHEFYTSGFYDYFSLLFSDASIANSYWREILLSLGESLPSLAILLLLGLSAALLWSLRSAVRDMRAAAASVRLA